jgi:Ca-activated chloride channel family protein
VTLTWPAMLLLVLLVPAGIWAYREIGRRRARRAAGLGGLEAGPVGSRRPRRTLVPGALFVAGMTVLLIALARPQATLGLPVERGTIVLAFDVSGSMAATDLQPTRMDAAKAAASAFVERQPSGIAIGVVAFSDSGLSVQVPSTDQTAVLAAIDRLTPERGTSLAQGIGAALGAIRVAESDGGPSYYTNRSPSPEPTPTPAPVPPGSHGSALIVLLTDGENNERPDPLAAGQAAADAGIAVDTVGIGSAGGADLDIGGFRVHTQLDAALLQQIADMTDGTYYAADSTDQLQAIYAHLEPRLVVEPQPVELTAALAGVGLLLLVVGAGASFVWLGRLP